MSDNLSFSNEDDDDGDDIFFTPKSEVSKSQIMSFSETKDTEDVNAIKTNVNDSDDLSLSSSNTSLENLLGSLKSSQSPSKNKSQTVLRSDDITVVDSDHSFEDSDEGNIEDLLNSFNSNKNSNIDHTDKEGNMANTKTTPLSRRLRERNPNAKKYSFNTSDFTSSPDLSFSKSLFTSTEDFEAELGFSLNLKSKNKKPKMMNKMQESLLDDILQEEELNLLLEEDNNNSNKKFAHEMEIDNLIKGQLSSEVYQDHKYQQYVDHLKDLILDGTMNNEIFDFYFINCLGEIANENKPKIGIYEKLLKSQIFSIQGSPFNPIYANIFKKITMDADSLSSFLLYITKESSVSNIISFKNIFGSNKHNLDISYDVIHKFLKQLGVPNEIVDFFNETRDTGKSFDFRNHLKLDNKEKLEHPLILIYKFEILLGFIMSSKAFQNIEDIKYMLKKCFQVVFSFFIDSRSNAPYVNDYLDIMSFNNSNANESCLGALNRILLNLIKWFNESQSSVNDHGDNNDINVSTHRFMRSLLDIVVESISQLTKDTRLIFRFISNISSIRIPIIREFKTILILHYIVQWDFNDVFANADIEKKFKELKENIKELKYYSEFEDKNRIFMFYFYRFLNIMKDVQLNDSILKETENSDSKERYHEYRKNKEAYFSVLFRFRLIYLLLIINISSFEKLLDVNRYLEYKYFELAKAQSDETAAVHIDGELDSEAAKNILLEGDPWTQINCAMNLRPSVSKNQILTAHIRHFIACIKENYFSGHVHTINPIITDCIALLSFVQGRFGLELKANEIF
ncbi:hypothetical protein BVG19_g1572 [[Candida] boidinii]|nr:hypothetical protein BVG19_g1572 [[Candida] boidinii]OWB50319.1 hypothetical protein B5S27_g1868 [[Candida] boidinii]